MLGAVDGAQVKNRRPEFGFTVTVTRASPESMYVPVLSGVPGIVTQIVCVPDAPQIAAAAWTAGGVSAASMSNAIARAHS
jgi:hypothetical protein